MSSQEWLNAFKIALINENIEKMDELNAQLPQFETVEQMKEAQAYIAQAADLMQQQQLELRNNMNKILKTKKYLKS
ncbi:MAG: hypothetical protein ACQESH_06800 [Campylobacterota bacterium]